MGRHLYLSIGYLAYIQDGGREVLGSSDDGHLYYSTNKGASWIRRR